MENIKIKIKSKLINYDLEFEHNTNIIMGNSATGKSFLINLIDNRESSNIDIESNYRLFHIRSKILELGIKLDEDTVYIMDECNGIEDKIVVDTINKNKYKFIIITRSAELDGISYDKNQVYEIFRSGKYNFSIKMYRKDLDKDREHKNWGWK